MGELIIKNADLAVFGRVTESLMIQRYDRKRIS